MEEMASKIKKKKKKKKNVILVSALETAGRQREQEGREAKE